MGVDVRHVVLRPLFQLWVFCACSLMSSAELQMPHTSYSYDLLTLIAEKVIDGPLLIHVLYHVIIESFQLEGPMKGHLVQLPCCAQGHL